MTKKAVRVGKIIKSKRISTVAGAWVFYFLTALIPLAFLLITAFSVFDIDVSVEIINKLPLEFRDFADGVINTAKNASRGVTIFFIIAVIFSGSTLISQMSKDGEYLYGIKSKTRKGLFRRLWAIVGLSGIYAIFLLVAVVFSFKKILYLSGVFGRFDLWNVIIILFTILFAYAIIILLENFISPVNLKFSLVVIGSTVSLIIMSLGTFAVIMYFRFFKNPNLFYGSLAGVLVFITWTFVIMLALILGAMVNTFLYKRNKEKTC